MTKKMLNSLIFTTISLLFSISSLATPPETFIPKLKTSPFIDGKLDDACWRNATKLSDFHIHKSNPAETTKDTRVLLTRDDKFIYFGISCNNPNMIFLDQQGICNDDSGIFKDDSIEIFLSRDGLKNYYQYVINYANVKGERRVSDTSGHEVKWGYPWITSTKQSKNGWTAEIAIPLEVLNAKEPGDLRLNIIRNKTNVQLDNMGAKSSEKRVHSFWAPVKKWAHEPKSFGMASGMRDTNRSPASLLIEIDKLKTEELRITGDTFSFNLNGRVLGISPVAGEIVVTVIERLADGSIKKIIEKSMSLPPRCQKELALKVPVSDFSQKTLILQIVDKKNNMLLVEKNIPFKGDTIKEAYPEFSFYSNEKNLRVKAVLGLSKATLSHLTLTLTNQAGKEIAMIKAPSQEVVLKTSTDVLVMGNNALSLNLLRKDGKVFGNKQVNVIRRKFNKNNESKTDHFRRIVLFKGKPYFPFGMYDGGMFSCEPVAKSALIKSLRNAKMNMLIVTSFFYNSHVKKINDLDSMTKTLAKSGVNMFCYGGVHPAGKGVGHLKSQEEKEKRVSEKYKKEIEPNALRCVKILKNQPNFLGWYGHDEANLGDWKTKLYVQSLFWQTLRKADPYHIVFGLYSSFIPRVPEATNNIDVLGFDIYTYPNYEKRGAYAKACDHMAALTSQLDKRAAETQKPIWVVALPGAYVGIPRSLSGQELLCQAYTTMIYGAKGLIYWQYNYTHGEVTWNALCTLGKRIHQFSPALLNYPVNQSINYASGTYNAAIWKIPPVPFRLFRFPNGKLIALAVNSKNYPIDLSVRMKGLSSVSRMFDDKKQLSIKNHVFRDKLEALGVRVYTFEIANNQNDMINVAISTKHYPKMVKKSVISNEKLIAEAKARKNKVMNPSFEITKNHGVPDFCWPYRIIRLHDIDGTPVDYALDKNNAKFGKVSLRITRPGGHRGAGVFGTIVPLKKQDKKSVFSFFAKAKNENTSIWVGLRKKDRTPWKSTTFKIGTEWKRYSMNGSGIQFLIQITEKDDLLPYTIWLDGLQMELGKTPTGFSE